MILVKYTLIKAVRQKNSPHCFCFKLRPNDAAVFCFRLCGNTAAVFCSSDSCSFSTVLKLYNKVLLITAAASSPLSFVSGGRSVHNRAESCRRERHIFEYRARIFVVCSRYTFFIRYAIIRRLNKKLCGTNDADNRENSKGNIESRSIA